MSVLINFKICDNAKECNGVRACPTGALSWDDNSHQIVIDNDKCVNCGNCQSTCLVGAIKVAKNEKEYIKYKKEIDDDPRKVSDLFVDRYGAETINDTFLTKEDDFNLEVLEACKLTAVEFYSEDSIQCLVRSIPVKELFTGIDLKYRRVEVKNDALLKRFHVKHLPSILFFNNRKLLGKIEGYFGYDHKNELQNKIKKIIKI